LPAVRRLLVAPAARHIHSRHSRESVKPPGVPEERRSVRRSSRHVRPGAALASSGVSVRRRSRGNAVTAGQLVGCHPAP
jgi:hypothetical protein